jgi:hypothetical protein
VANFPIRTRTPRGNTKVKRFFAFGNYGIYSQGSTGGISSDVTSFNLPLLDLGAGAVSLTPLSSLGDGTPTFTRATAAWTKLSSGLWASVATGVARSMYSGAGTTVGSYVGYWSEGARTNLCLQSRDLSTTWTALNATLLKDQVGIDGVGNSASSMTATLANGSALQTITEAATLSALSVFIKRITGTGTVTIQQGASTLEVSASLNSSTYTRIELDATVLNPAIGIVLGTGSDKIAVDMVQFENGASASTPIPTTTVAVSRNADILTYPTAGNAGVSGALYFELSVANTAATMIPVQIDDGSDNNRIASYTGTQFNSYIVSGGVVQATNAIGAITANTIAKLAEVSTTGNMQIFANGTAGTKVTTGVNPVSVSTIRISGTSGGISPLFGGIKNLRIYPTALSAAQLQSMTT